MKNRLAILFLFSRIFFLSLAFLSAFFIPLREGYLGNQLYPQLSNFVWPWANFDGRHYLDIATNGYRNFNFAYFPLYPALIHLFNFFVDIPAIYIGIFISFISLLLAMIIIYKITKIDFNNRISNMTLLLISFFPLSFFYHAVYPDALFLLLSSLSFYNARRGRWLLAGLFGSLTVLTRLSGLALIPALLAEWFLQNKEVLKSKKIILISFWRKNFNTLALIFLGFIGYLLYLEVIFGDFLLFQKSMIAWRQNEFIFPLQVIVRYFKILLQVDKGLLEYWIALLEFISTILYFLLTLFVVRKIRISYAIFMFFVFLLPTFTGTFAGMPRYILHTFPAFIGLAFLLNNYQRLKILVIIIFLILGFLFTGLFTRGYFIA